MKPGKLSANGFQSVGQIGQIWPVVPIAKLYNHQKRVRLLSAQNSKGTMDAEHARYVGINPNGKLYS